MSSNPLWDLIQRYMDLPMHRYRPLAADLARETGVSDQVISKWKAKPMLPTAEQLSKFSAGTGIAYVALLEAALQGKGYLPTSDKVQMAIQGPGRETMEWMRSMEGGPEGFLHGWRPIDEPDKISARDRRELEEHDRKENQAATRRRHKSATTNPEAVKTKAIRKGET